MRTRFHVGVIALSFASLVLLSAFQAGRKPEEEFVGIVRAYLGKGFVTDWEGIEKLPKIKWALLPPTMLKNCLADGGCFTRQGTVTIGGRNLTVIATGARTMVSHVYVRNPSAPLGEAAVVSALKKAAFSADLARCPVRSGAGSTNWYSLKGEKVNPGHLSIQTSCNGKACEGFVLSQSEQLPPLQPNQLALYSEACAAGVERKPVATTKPHVQLAETIKSLLPPAAGPALYDWKGLAGLPSGITWAPEGPKPVDLSFKHDPNPLSQTGGISYSGRQFHLLASGTPTQVKTIYFDEGGMHPRGEHMLGVLYEEGLVVRLVRCGPVYTESTNNWYSVMSPRTRPVMVKQSILYDGNQVGDSYEVRLDGSLPARDSRDRNPGVNGC